MRILLWPDKFKGTLTSAESAAAIQAGILRAQPNAIIRCLPASDGGDGFLDAVLPHISAEPIQGETVDALGRPIQATWLWDEGTHTAYIELARTCGLALLPEEVRNPWHTSTLGAGMQLRQALAWGAQRVCLGLGGSATNDAGLGIIGALGWTFRDQHGGLLHPCGGNLRRIARLQPGLRPDGVEVLAIHDVDNPLHGVKGAAYTYAAQKGADPAQVEGLDQGLQWLERLLEAPVSSTEPGSGAAGGAAYGLRALLGARYMPGTTFIMEKAGADSLLQTWKPSVLVTGEGRIDATSLSGKWVSGMLELGRRHDIPVLGFCGQLDLDPYALKAAGFGQVWESMARQETLAFNMAHAHELLEERAYQAFSRPDMLSDMIAMASG